MKWGAGRHTQSNSSSHNLTPPGHHLTQQREGSARGGKGRKGREEERRSKEKLW